MLCPIAAIDNLGKARPSRLVIDACLLEQLDAAVEVVARSDEQVRVGALQRRAVGLVDGEGQVSHPFHRVEASRSPDAGGSGLGLAIVRQLAQSNGWTVALENRADGGLAAWVTVPDARSES